MERFLFRVLAWCLSAIALFSIPAFAEDDVAARMAALEKRVKELEAQTVLSLPELIVKQKKAYVCEKGHSFGQAQEANKCPHDGSKVTAQTTYQKEKYFRRKSIEDKIEEALADIQPVSIGISATGQLFHTFSTGRGLTAPENKKDLFGSGSFDLSLTAKPAYNTVIFVDLEALADTGARNRIPTYTSTNSDGNRLAEPNAGRNEEVQLREAWISTVLGHQQEYTLVAGSMDLAAVVDQNALANNETLQFISDLFVNNAFLGKPENGAAFAAMYDPKGLYALKFAVQRLNANIATSKIGGRLYSVAELHLRARPYKGWQNGNYRFWIRALGETDRRENIGYGVSFDQRFTRSVALFGRYGAQRTTDDDDQNTTTRPLVQRRDDIHYSAGFEVRGPEWTFLPRDIWGAAYGRTEIRSAKGRELVAGGVGAVGESETQVEGYYKVFITEHMHATPFVQWLADSDRAEPTGRDDLVIGFRTQVDF